MPRQAGMADREPCPWRIVDDVGGAFCMGAIGGAVWHGVKGLRLSPSGSKLSGSSSFVAARAPVLGGQFAVWGGLFACCDCTLTAARQKVKYEGSVCGECVVMRPQLLISTFLTGRSLEFNSQRCCDRRDSCRSRRSQGHGIGGCRRRRAVGPDRGHGDHVYPHGSTSRANGRRLPSCHGSHGAAAHGRRRRTLGHDATDGQWWR